MGNLVLCPICDELVEELIVNEHIDSNCTLKAPPPPARSSAGASAASASASTLLAPLFNAAPSSSSISSTAHAGPSAKRRQSSDHPPSSSTSAAGAASRKRPSSPPPARRAHAGEAADKKPRLTAAGAVRSVQPLAERLRPKTLDEFFGHDTLLSPSTGALRSLILADTLGSALFWGPPGTGKTTLAALIASHTDASYHALSATAASVADVRKVLDGALNQLRLTGRRTLLFVDELHRFTKSQLDVFLPPVESGTIQLIGATSENPSFTINRALLSRLKIFALDKLSTDALKAVLRRAVRAWRAERAHEPWLATPAAAGGDLVSGMDDGMLDFLAGIADGDCRVALNSLETALQLITHRLAPADRTTPLSAAEKHELMGALKGTLSLRYDRTGDARYDMISALHKALRGSDGGAALYWLARMLTAGEDPLYICRRLVVVASEDVGLADLHALPLATATLAACQQVGMPECRINLAHCVAYLAEAQKSTRAYAAYGEAVRLCESHELYEVPVNVRNAPTKLMKDLGHGQGYAYNPAFAHPVANEYLPPQLAHVSSFAPDVGQRLLQPEGSGHGKQWDEPKLQEWERSRNGGRPWEGRG